MKDDFDMEIKEYEVYTPNEAKTLLKVSSSTITRMIKSGLIRTAKVGRQYRILGKELLRILSPELEDHVGIAYNKMRRWAHDESPFIPPEKKKTKSNKEKKTSS